MRLFDTHAHILDPAFDEDREELVRTFSDAGLIHIVECSCCTEDIEPIRELCRKHPAFLATAGSHPENASLEEIRRIDRIRKRASEADCFAVGEIGLDYHYSDGPEKEIQIRLFAEQVDIARELHKPVLIHDRDAHADMMNLLSARKSGLSGIMHCYSGSYEDAVRYIDMGLYIAFGGAITFHNAVRQAGIVSRLPIERILVETDCPYMTPVPYRGKRNNPCFVRYAVEKIAELKHMEAEEVAEITCRNAEIVFGLDSEV